MYQRPDAAILFPSIPNFRDLGGLPLSAGRGVRKGVVFRSELISSLTPNDQVTLSGLNIRGVIDLRSLHEREASPSAWPQPTDSVTVRTMREELHGSGADLQHMVQGLRDATLDAVQVGEIMNHSYRAMPAQFATTLARLFRVLAHQGEGATLVHCTAGKDRTGFVCAMLLLALGVPMEAVMADYLRSGRFYSVQRLCAQMERVTGQPLDSRLLDVVHELALVKPSYLEESLAEIARQWGSVSGYLRGPARLGVDLHERLLDRMLD